MFKVNIFRYGDDWACELTVDGRRFQAIGSEPLLAGSSALSRFPGVAEHVADEVKRAAAEAAESVDRV
jgi:hypothetical protein